MKSISSIPGPELRKSILRTRVTLAMLSALLVLRAPISRIFKGGGGLELVVVVVVVVDSE